MEKTEIDILSNEKIPEAVRAAIAQSILSAETAKADRALEQTHLDIQRKKFLWNTPLVATVAGLITLSATSVFDRLSKRDDTNNEITLATLRQELTDSEARLQQQLATEATKTVAEIEALASERQFQYEIVRAELTNPEKSNASRAAVLLFLVRAGVLSTLNREELQAMAEDQIENPDKNIIPQLASSPDYRAGVFGADDAQPVTGFPEGHPVKYLAPAVGVLEITSYDGSKYVCTAFLVDQTQVATVARCSEMIVSAIFKLGSASYAIDVNNKKVFGAGMSDGYVFLRITAPVPDNIKPLRIASGVSEQDMQLGMIYYRAGSRAGSEALAVWGAQDCRARKWESKLFYHLCDTGGGASGAPVFDASTNLVVGIQSRRSEFGGVAIRLDDSQASP